MQRNKSEQEVMITVYVNTFNHREYIRDALEGILNQRTDYRFNCFIYDDSSTDGTSVILKEYISKYPDIFNAYISPYNTYGKPEDRRTIWNKEIKNNLTGKYIAICEGDDYWTDPLKLQIQVSFLESHPECVFSAHGSVWNNYFNGTVRDHILYKEDCIIPEEDFFLFNDFPPSTASLVIRKDIYMQKEMDSTYPKTKIGDFPLMLYCILYGKCFYSKRIMSVYRYMTEGSFTRRTTGIEWLKFSIDYLRFLYEYNKYSQYRFSECVKIFSNQQILTTVDKMRIEIGDEYDACKEAIEGLYEIKQEYGNYINAHKKMLDIVMGDEGLSQNDVSTLMNAEHIVVFGCGKYSSVVEDLLRRRTIDFDGYIVSQKMMYEYNGKKIWDFKDYPNDKSNTVIVVGVSYVFIREVESLLIKEGYKFIAPLWRNLCTWM